MCVYVYISYAVLSHSVISNSLGSHGLQPSRLLCPWHSPGKNTGVRCHALLQGNLPNPGIKPRSPTLQVDSLSTEPQGKPKNTGMGSLSCLLGIFPTQESNWGLLHCRQILYQLSYQRSVHTHTHTGILLSHKKNEIIASAATWPSEVSQTEKDKYHMIITDVWNCKDDTNELVFKNRNRITKKTNLGLPKGKGGEE